MVWRSANALIARLTIASIETHDREPACINCCIATLPSTGDGLRCSATIAAPGKGDRALRLSLATDALRLCGAADSRPTGRYLSTNLMMGLLQRCNSEFVVPLRRFWKEQGRRPSLRQLRQEAPGKANLQQTAPAIAVLCVNARYPARARNLLWCSSWPQKCWREIRKDGAFVFRTLPLRAPAHFEPSIPRECSCLSLQALLIMALKSTVLAFTVFCGRSILSGLETLQT